MTRREGRSGFAAIEPFVVAPIFLIVGLATTFLLRWGLATSHWTTWIPLAVLGIPFVFFYGQVVPVAAFSNFGERMAGRDR